jgi:hypothetical protein
LKRFQRPKRLERLKHLERLEPAKPVERLERSNAVERLERFERASVFVARHRVSLEARFQCQKAASKLLNDAFYATLLCEINQLRRSDPDLKVPRGPIRGSTW